MNENTPEFEEWTGGSDADALDREEFWRGATALARLRKIIGDELEDFFNRAWK